MDNQEREAFKKQTEYIEELKKKNMKVTVRTLFPLAVTGEHVLQRS